MFYVVRMEWTHFELNKIKYEYVHSKFDIWHLHILLSHIQIHHPMRMWNSVTFSSFVFLVFRYSLAMHWGICWFLPVIKTIVPHILSHIFRRKMNKSEIWELKVKIRYFSLQMSRSIVPSCMVSKRNIALAIVWERTARRKILDRLPIWHG